MTSKNDITGDEIKTKSSTENFREGWDRIFGKKHKEEVALSEDKEVDKKQEE